MFAVDDPEDEPFRSKYAARQLLENVRREFQEERDKHSDGEFAAPCEVKLAVVDALLGVNYANTVRARTVLAQQVAGDFNGFLMGTYVGGRLADGQEELSEGERHLNRAVATLEKHPEAVRNMANQYT